MDKMCIDLNFIYFWQSKIKKNKYVEENVVWWSCKLFSARNSYINNVANLNYSIKLMINSQIDKIDNSDLNHFKQNLILDIYGFLESFLVACSPTYLFQNFSSTDLVQYEKNLNKDTIKFSNKPGDKHSEFIQETGSKNFGNNFETLTNIRNIKVHYFSIIEKNNGGDKGNYSYWQISYNEQNQYSGKLKFGEILLTKMAKTDVKNPKQWMKRPFQTYEKNSKHDILRLFIDLINDVLLYINGN